MRFEREDAKVGLLVLLALGLFLALAFHRVLVTVQHREVVHRMRLENVADLAVGTPVLLQGNRVGETRAVTLERQGKAYSFVADLGLRPDLVLWRGTRGVLVSPVLGSAYLELRLPPLAERTAELPPGELMEGEPGPSLDGLIGELSRLARNLDRAIADLRGELTTRGLGALLDHPRVAGALDEARAALAAFRGASQTAGTTFVHGDSTLTALDQSLLRLDESLVALRQLIERRSPDLEAALDELTGAAGRIHQVTDQVDAWVKTSGPQADSTIRALRRTLESLEELLELLKAKPNRMVLGTPTEAERAAARERVEAARRADQSATPAPAAPPASPTAAPPPAQEPPPPPR